MKVLVLMISVFTVLGPSYSYSFNFLEGNLNFLVYLLLCSTPTAQTLISFPMMKFSYFLNLIQFIGIPPLTDKKRHFWLQITISIHFILAMNIFFWNLLVNLEGNRSDLIIFGFPIVIFPPL